ncbi:MAG TPA: hypothetical protein VJU58_11300 [Microbacterium sp.]|nr:hypothetical protein [Microbacterium sp.]
MNTIIAPADAAQTLLLDANDDRAVVIGRLGPATTTHPAVRSVL